MGLFDLIFGDDNQQKRNKRHRDQEMSNMYELGWDEKEDSYVKRHSEKEKFSNYEYYDEE